MRDEEASHLVASSATYDFPLEAEKLVARQFATRMTPVTKDGGQWHKK